jgi:hypothetical protein
MSKKPLALGGGVVAILVAIGAVGNLSPNGRPDETLPVAAAVGEGQPQDPELEPAMIAAPAPVSVREPVEVPPATEPADPCGELRAALDAEIGARAVAEAAAEDLRAEVARLTVELQRLRIDPHTPYGAFLASFEAEEIRDPYHLERIEDWLRQFPVLLRPGEATWIVQRTTAKDWKTWGRTSERALIAYLGPARLRAELPPERLAELAAYYQGEGLFD